jgi:EmrB/QacA subfamily drug resistance transporter
MVVLDIAIVNVALPSIQFDLGFSQDNLQWVISAYALVFGGFLLLGGRMADLLGRRRIFVVGTIVFTLGSLLCGLAWSEESLIGARAIQGLGAAMITPAALAILVTTFTEGRERNIALGAWGAVGGFGAAAGVLFGGILTDLLSWEWIFFVNIPVGLTGLVLTPFLLSESSDRRGQGFDALGAILVTSGLSTLVLGITQGRDWGWGSAATIGVFAVAGVLLAAFIAWESRVKDPLMPFSIFRLRTLTAANIAGFILGTALFAMFLMLTLYMQQVLGYSPIKTGFAYLAVAGTAVIWANVAAVVVNRVGVKPALIFGMTLLTIGLVYFTQVSVGGSYWTDLFPGFLIIGLAIPFAFVPISIAAFAGTRPDEAGLASGLMNTSQQIGGAVGIAILSTIAVSTTSDASPGTPVPVALTDGFQAAFWAGAAIALAGVLVSIFLVRGRDLRPQELPAVEPALEAA